LILAQICEILFNNAASARQLQLKGCSYLSCDKLAYGCPRSAPGAGQLDRLPSRISSDAY